MKARKSEHIEAIVLALVSSCASLSREEDPCLSVVVEAFELVKAFNSSFSMLDIWEEANRRPYPMRWRVESTPEDVERTFERRVIHSSVLELKRGGIETGSWVVLSEAIISSLPEWQEVYFNVAICCFRYVRREVVEIFGGRAEAGRLIAIGCGVTRGRHCCH